MRWAVCCLFVDNQINLLGSFSWGAAGREGVAGDAGTDCAVAREWDPQILPPLRKQVFGRGVATVDKSHAISVFAVEPYNQVICA